MPLKNRKRTAIFQREFREDLRHWVEVDRKTALRAFNLVEEILRNPFEGIGNLNHSNILVRAFGRAG